MRSPLLPVMAGLLAGCVPDAGLTPTDAEPCGVTVDATWPAPGAGDVYYRSSIEFHLSEATAAMVVTEIEGYQSRSADGRVVRFTPDRPLAPDTPYTAALHYCGGTPEIAFTTSAVGGPLECDPTDLVGQTWALDLFSARYLQGEVLADLAAVVWDDVMLVGVTESDGEWVSFRIARPDETGLAQDHCHRTVDLPAAAFHEAPYFAVAPVDLWVDVDDAGLMLLELEATGAFDPWADTVQGITLRATVDLREVLALLGAGDLDEICGLASSSGAPCRPCPTDREVACVTVEADDATAVRLPDVALDAVDGRGTHPLCTP